MQVLNLIRPEKSSIKYKVIQFPDGEPHIVLKDIDRKDYLSVICRICNPTDLFILMQVGDILNRQGVLFSLNITYLMSMRMDRVISYDESFSLMVNPKGIATLSENYKEVYFTNSYRDWGREALPDNVKVIEVV